MTDILICLALWAVIGPALIALSIAEVMAELGP
jgi:hypothetical protein